MEGATTFATWDRWRLAGILLWAASAPLAAADTYEHVIEHSKNTNLRYRCLVMVPDEYHDRAHDSWPMILFLHGGGSPSVEGLTKSVRSLTRLPALVLAPICPLSPEGKLYTNWDWQMLGHVVRQVSDRYRVDPQRRSVIGFSMGGSGAWELPFYEPDLFVKSVAIAGVCHPWSLRHYPKIPVWAFVGSEDFMRKEQQETISSARRFGVDVVETVWKGADHGKIFWNARSYDPMLQWLVSQEDLRFNGEIAE